MIRQSRIVLKKARKASSDGETLKKTNASQSDDDSPDNVTTLKPTKKGKARQVDQDVVDQVCGDTSDSIRVKKSSKKKNRKPSVDGNKLKSVNEEKGRNESDSDASSIISKHKDIALNGLKREQKKLAKVEESNRSELECDEEKAKKKKDQPNKMSKNKLSPKASTDDSEPELESEVQRRATKKSKGNRRAEEESKGPKLDDVSEESAGDRVNAVGKQVANKKTLKTGTGKEASKKVAFDSDDEDIPAKPESQSDSDKLLHVSLINGILGSDTEVSDLESKENVENETDGSSISSVDMEATLPSQTNTKLSKRAFSFLTQQCNDLRTLGLSLVQTASKLQAKRVVYKKATRPTEVVTTVEKISKVIKSAEENLTNLTRVLNAESTDWTKRVIYKAKGKHGSERNNKKKEKAVKKSKSDIAEAIAKWDVVAQENCDIDSSQETGAKKRKKKRLDDSPGALHVSSGDDSTGSEKKRLKKRKKNKRDSPRHASREKSENEDIDDGGTPSKSAECVESEKSSENTIEELNDETIITSQADDAIPVVKRVLFPSGSNSSSDERSKNPDGNSKSRSKVRKRPEANANGSDDEETEKPDENANSSEKSTEKTKGGVVISESEDEAVVTPEDSAIPSAKRVLNFLSGSNSSSDEQSKNPDGKSKPKTTAQKDPSENANGSGAEDEGTAKPNENADETVNENDIDPDVEKEHEVDEESQKTQRYELLLKNHGKEPERVPTDDVDVQSASFHSAMEEVAISDKADGEKADSSDSDFPVASPLARDSSREKSLPMYSESETERNGRKSDKLDRKTVAKPLSNGRKSDKPDHRTALLESDSSDDDFLSAITSTKAKLSDSDSSLKLGKRKKKKRPADFTKPSPKSKRKKIDLSRFNDPKLSIKCVVVLERLELSELRDQHNIHEFPEVVSDAGSNDSYSRLANIGPLGKLHTSKKKRSRTSSESGSGQASTRTKKLAKKKKKTETQKLTDFLGDKLSDSELSAEEPLPPAEGTNAPSTFKLLPTNELIKRQIMADTSNSEDDDDDEFSALKVKKKETPKKEKKKKAASDDDASAKEDVSDEELVLMDNDSENEAKKKKASWKSNKLLRGKLALTDSSDEERKCKVKAEKEAAKKAKDSNSDSDFAELPVKKLSLTKRKLRSRIASDSDRSIVSIHDSSSDSDGDFVVKKKPQKKKSSNSSSSESDKPKTPKRRRIRAPATSDSDIEEIEDSQRSTPGKGRKNIRKVMKEESVGEKTRRAAKEEEERRKRIQEKQKLYNSIYSQSTADGEPATDKLVLDFDPETKEALVEVNENIVKRLKPHQIEGIKFMWDACYESVAELRDKPGSGCILAHCMGLGKTMQVVSLVHTLLTNRKTKVNTVLIVCPLSTIHNWEHEFQMWMKLARRKDNIEIHVLSRCKKLYERSYRLREWHQDGGIMIVGYEMFRSLVNSKPSKAAKTFRETLIDPGPDLVICDEGHLLKNNRAAVSKAMKEIKSLRRIILTGTPLQNNLVEYHCMVDFVKPSLLGTLKEFTNRFVNPIVNGQHSDSTPADVKVMKRRAHVLHKMLEGSVQRYDYSTLAPLLPPKHEYAIMIRLTENQIKMYQYYLDNYSGKASVDMGAKNNRMLQDWQYLSRVNTHPKCLQWHTEETIALALDKENSEDSEGSLKDFIDDDDDSDSSSKSSSASSGSDKSGSENGGKKGKKVEKAATGRSRRLAGLEPAPLPAPVASTNSGDSWWRDFCTEDDLESLRSGGKLQVLFSLIDECDKIGDKLLVFSQSLGSLNLIEEFLTRIDEDTQKRKADDETVNEQLDGHKGSWTKGLDYFRLDGQVSIDQRTSDCKQFNSEKNARARLFLISTRAGGLGINLYGANRVVIFDPCWNPSLDMQSIFRVYRFGQKKPCYIYRFIAYGTMEERIYERQVTKLSLASRVVDEHQVERHYSIADMMAMYQFEPHPKPDRPTPMVPKDRLFADLIQKHTSWIETYHEHDSLLENIEGEELNEDERKAAWEDFENEKKGQTMMTDVMLINMVYSNPEQLKQYLRMENPTATEEQIEQKVQLLRAQIQYQQTQRIMAQAKNMASMNQKGYPGQMQQQMPVFNPVTKQYMYPQARQLPSITGAYAHQGVLVGQANHPGISNQPQAAPMMPGSGQGMIKVRSINSLQEPRKKFDVVPTMQPYRPVRLPVSIAPKPGGGMKTSGGGLINPMYTGPGPIILGKAPPKDGRKAPQPTSPDITIID